MKKGAFRNFKSEEKMKKKKWILGFDTNQLSMNHILIIKDIFRTHPGMNPLEILFFNQKKKLGELHIDTNWGVSDDMEWVEKMKNCPGLMQIEYVEIT